MLPNIDYASAERAASYIKQHVTTLPTAAIILGSGLGGFAQQVKILHSLPYAQIPGFPPSNVSGHKAQLSLAELADGQLIWLMEGRLHYYEGLSLQSVTLPIVVLSILKVQNLIISNAAGGINPNFQVGDLMLITDHINLTGVNPLRGSNNAALGPRFPDMSEPYSLALLEAAKAAAQTLAYVPRQGVYLGVAGPSYETKAEIRAFATLGADAIGMSTIFEVLIANYFKMNVLGISCITNLATGVSEIKHQHEAVIAAAEAAEQIFTRWMMAILTQLK